MKKLLTLLIFTAVAISPAFANDESEDRDTTVYICDELTEEEIERLDLECDEGDEDFEG